MGAHICLAGSSWKVLPVSSQLKHKLTEQQETASQKPAMAHLVHCDGAARSTRAQKYLELFKHARHGFSHRQPGSHLPPILRAEADMEDHKVTFYVCGGRLWNTRHILTLRLRLHAAAISIHLIILEVMFTAC